MSKSSVVQDLMFKVRKVLADWLHERLTAVNASYWDELVVQKLSFQQRAMVESRQYTSLANLDFAGLLRVFDKNWFDLDYKVKLNPQMRAYLKELMIARNRYAHQSEDVEDDEYLRDIDTLYRFAKGIGCPQELLSEIRNAAGAHEDEVGDVDAQPEVKEQKVQPEIATSVFKVGEIVRLKSSPEIAGAVVAICGDEVSVFANGNVNPYFVDQIERAVAKTQPFLPIPQAKNNLTSFLIRHPAISSLYSLNAARIDVIPYQFRPVMKMIRSDQPRLLIADSVGIGKTIEAGLIFRELQIRNDVQSVLIICPKPLITERKWESEMKRFDEDFSALDASDLRYCLSECDKEGVWPSKYSKAILPFSVCDERLLKSLDALDPKPKFDLVIVDEAHHIRNSQSLRYQVTKAFCESANAIVFLTATPLQMDEKDLFTLLNLLRPDLVPDLETFNTMHAPNGHINAAIRHAKAREYAAAAKELSAAGSSIGSQFVVGHPDYASSLDILKRGDLSDDELVRTVAAIGRFHTFNGLINRTVRKEIAADFAVRHPETVRTEMTAHERKVYESTLTLRRMVLNALHGNVNAAFMMTMLERQAASCIHGLAPFLRAAIMKSLLTSDAEPEEGVSLELGEDLLARFNEAVDKVCELAERLPESDPKFDKFFEIIREKQGLENKKVIVFSTFRHTLAYIERRLKDAGIRVAVIHGGIDDRERQTIRGRFELASEDAQSLDVLLFSEVGCEGLDYQFCDTMINYDLPWNPMKIEQRIGRIDRFGQKSAAVAIYNMVVEDTVDARIYDRCLNRISIFEQSIGTCDRILGEIHNEIKKVAEATSLSPAQQEEKLEQIALNSVNQLRAQSELEDRQAELFTIPAKFSAAKEMSGLENYWLSPDSLARMVTSYIRQRTGKEMPIVGTEARRTLNLANEARQMLYEDFTKLQVRKGRLYAEWSNYLKGANPNCAVTFDTELACKEKSVQFIMPLHPLVQQAAEYFKSDALIATAIKVVDEDVPTGEYPFMIYIWEYKGLANAIQLKAFSTNDAVQDKLLEYLETGAPTAKTSAPSEAIASIKSRVKVLWDAEKEAHRRNIERWTEYKIHSLEVSTAAQKRAAEAKKVEKIREGELRKIEARHSAAVEKLRRGTSAADIIIKPILTGVVKIVHEEV